MPVLDQEKCPICDGMTFRNEMAYKDRVRMCRSCRGEPPLQIDLQEEKTKAQKAREIIESLESQKKQDKVRDLALQIAKVALGNSPVKDP